jgi:hypothetical protein
MLYSHPHHTPARRYCTQLIMLDRSVMLSAFLLLRSNNDSDRFCAMRSIEEFWSNVDQSAGPNACWPWTRARTGPEHNYGWVGWYGKGMRSHRLAYMLANDVVMPSSDFVLHSCDNAICCNPRHLSVGTQKENIRQAIERGRARIHGEQHGASKMTNAQAAEMRRRRADGEDYKTLAIDYGVHYQTAYRICKRKIRSST